MDDLDRLYRRLIHNIRATRPEYLRIPFSVQELYEQLVPYRHNRREMAIETNQDYEVAVARLLSGERGYVRAEHDIQEALRRELASPTGDPGMFKEHAQAQITVTSLADVTPTPGATPGSIPRPAGAMPQQAFEPVPTVNSSVSGTVKQDTIAPRVTDSASPPPQVPALLSSLTSIPVPTGCRFCGGTLPDGRDVSYCPHCGENLKTQRCPACGDEMDATWKFCVSCGRRGG